MADHFADLYSCGKHVWRQCRCASKDKRVTVTKQPCPFCSFDAKPESTKGEDCAGSEPESGARGA